MLGYVTTYKPELKMKHWDIYRAYYCAICRSIKTRYGEIPRLVLSYDSVLLAIVLDSVKDKMLELSDENDPVTRLTTFRCGYHPTIKRPLLSDGGILVDYAADMLILLALLKLEDDKNDEKRFSSKARNIATLGLQYNIRKKVRTHLADYDLDGMYEMGALMIRETISAEHLFMKNAQEQNQGSNQIFETIAKPFADFLAEIFDFPYSSSSLCKLSSSSSSCEQNGNLQDYSVQLRTLGKSLGMWIYLMDAVDDRTDDLKKGTFNPFALNGFSPGLQDERIAARLYLSSASNAISKLQLCKNREIIDNIVNVGLYAKTEEIMNKAENLSEQPL
ncbi:MAG: DUF5685 family protein [Clostridiales Family XIII bacterium]|jgi:hypothetical protein|nr:DUF5685 family protein [Clostridiales Family XIII bacterium]